MSICAIINIIKNIRRTDKMKKIYPAIKQITTDWNDIISEAISHNELETFNSILDKILQKSIEISEKQEENI